MRALGLSAVLAVTAIAPNLPPVKGWPPYPHFPVRSCWARVTDPSQVGTVGGAPSYVTHTARRSPRAVVASVLAGLGDRRFVKRVEIGPVPRLVREHNGWFKQKPPRDALWAWLDVPRERLQYAKPPAAAVVQANSIADWEAQLVWGALRDAFCANGGAPLVGWSVAGHPSGVSDALDPLGQRFPSPTRAAFGARARAVGRAFGFDVVSIRWLRARQPAPAVVVRTNRERKAFVGDVEKIVQLLDPRRSTGNRTATTFEDFYLEALDGRGPFTSVENVYRGEVMGGEWSWDPCVTPYPHSAMFNQHC
jgi:hypothetical protein